MSSIIALKNWPQRACFLLPHEGTTKNYQSACLKKDPSCAGASILNSQPPDL